MAIDDLHEYTTIYRPHHIIELVCIPPDVMLTQNVVDLLPEGTVVVVRWTKRGMWQREVVGKDAGGKSYASKIDGAEPGRRLLTTRIGFVGHEDHRNNVKVISLPFG